MASNVNAAKVSIQGSSTKSHQSQPPNFDHLEKTSNTLKRNPKMELSKSDLLKLLSYLEGELQARDIVIATLKCERVKQLLNQGRNHPLLLSDPHASLQSDSFASVEPRVDEVGIRALANQQMASLENLVLQYRRGQMHLGKILKDAEDRHKKELELEKQKSKKLERDFKKVMEVLEDERKRQKGIVLLLLAERKKIIMKYIEERKRSEDLAQILSEEKTRVDAMAEGLEEESKKSLQMEAELEKQFVQFDAERQQLRLMLTKEENRLRELEVELEKTKSEADALKKQLVEAHQVAMFQASSAVGISPSRVMVPRAVATAIPPQPSVKPSVIPSQGSVRSSVQPAGSLPISSQKIGGWGQGATRPDGSISPPPPAAGTPMMSSVAKVVQPTATVSSVPVCGPTTGIARCVSPGQGLRNMVNPSTVLVSWPSLGQSAGTTPEQSQSQVGDKKNQQQTNQAIPSLPRVNMLPSSSKNLTSQGSKVAASHLSSDFSTELPKKPVPPGRGIPPPVPPNKPVVPPKKETILSRRSETALIDVSKTCGSNPGINVIKDSSQSGDHHVVEDVSHSTPENLHDTPTTVSATTTASGQGLEILGQELADFQLQFVSMAASKRAL